MSGGSDKTEKPTQRKIEESRKQGMVAKSIDLTTALVILGIVCLLAWYGPVAIQYFLRMITDYLSNKLPLALNPMTPTFLIQLITITIGHFFIVLSPFLLVPMLIGVLSNVFQVKPLVSLQPIAPKLEKLNPLQGIQRQFSKKSMVELVKGVIKLTVISAVAYFCFDAHYHELFNLNSRGVIVGWQRVFNLIFDTTMYIALTMLVIGLGDWFVQKYLLMKQLMMTKQEVRDEMRNMEGNPEVKQQVRQQGRKIATTKMLAAVPTADVILVNPTHYSVALQYDPDVSPAPRVVAKGVDHLALKIREIAKEHRIPIYENPPLARTLYATLEINQMVPPELFVAVAEILAFVFQKTKGRGNKARRQNNNTLPAALGGAR